jgi:hypothetical protein
VHYEGWQHFLENPSTAAGVLAAADSSIRDRVRWLPVGIPTVVSS